MRSLGVHFMATYLTLLLPWKGGGAGHAWRGLILYPSTYVSCCEGSGGAGGVWLPGLEPARASLVLPGVGAGRLPGVAIYVSDGPLPGRAERIRK